MFIVFTNIWTIHIFCSIYGIYAYGIYTHSHIYIYMSDIVASYINLLSYILDFHLHATETETKEAAEEL